jgi:chemotaxis protein MotD
MTRAGAVAEQMPMPSKVVSERVREQGSKTDGANQQGEADGEFSALLSKLNGGSDRHSDASANDLPDGSSTPTEWRGARHRTRVAGPGDEAGEDDAEGRAATDRPPRSDTDLVDAALLGTPSKAAESGGAQSESSKTDNVTAKDIADILSLTSSQHAAAKDQSSKTGQDVRAGVPPKAIVGAEAKPIIEASAGPETRVAAQAAQIAPASNGQLDQKDAVRSRTPATDAAFTSSADVPKSTMPGLVVTPPARNDLPKAKVVRQEAHLPPVAASTMHARGGVAAVAGGKLGTGSEAKDNKSAALFDTGLISADGPASGAVQAPTQQIANRIATELSAFEGGDRVPAEPNQVAAKPLLKVLQIQLQPAELGTVSIRMELREGGLELHVEAAKAETAEIIRGDKDKLSNLLRSSGYNVDGNSIRVAEVDRTAASQQTGQQGAQTNMQSSAQSNYGGAERNAREHRGTGGSSGGDTSTQANRTDIHETNASRASGGLYI